MILLILNEPDEAAMTKITKGTEIYKFGMFDETTCYVERLTVTSFGKKHGTAVRMQDGKPIESRLYAVDEATTFINKQGEYFVCLIPVADVPDVESKAMELARQIKQYYQDHYRNAQHASIDAAEVYHRAISKKAREQFDKPVSIKINF